MRELPRGVVTFLFTDVEGSTRLWEEAPDTMMEALRRHDAEIEAAASAHHGVPVRPRGEGDSRFLVFDDAADAVAAAAEMQRRLAAAPWPTPRPLRVRAAVHTGPADLQLGDYYGSAVNRAARLRGIAHGGQTLLSQATRDLISDDDLPGGVSLRDMGEHRLKDLTRPERVYQIDVAGLDDRFPPLESLNEVPNNLPIQITEFIGRREELAEAKQLLTGTRLLTILAPGGTGKTRLAIQAAADLVGEHPDGVFFVGFADIDSSDDIFQATAEALGVAFTGDDDVKTQLLTHLATRRQLLVFDNMEHLEGAPGAVAEILQAAPHLTIVATSRSKLNLTGETVLALAGLDTTWETPEEAGTTSGVQLFVEAAGRANPSFAVEATDLESLGEILRLTGGSPLGILLSAAWVDMLPIDEIAAEIARSIDFLETEMSDIPERQRSIRAVFDYSWALLGPDERETFAALSAFRGGFTRDAAEEVAGASLRGLANLVSKSLLTASPETGRYEVHELLRQYAAAELEQDPERHREVIARHAAFYAALMDRAPALIEDSRQDDLLAIVVTDIENIRFAWRHLVATGAAATARKFIVPFFLVYEFRGWYQSAITLFDETLETLPADPGDEDVVMLRALASAVRGWHLTLLSRPVEGAEASAGPNEVLSGLSDPMAHWVSVQCLALSLAYLGRAEEMAASLDAAVERFEALPHPFWVASMQDWQSFAALLAGDLEGTKRYAAEAEHVSGSGGEYWVTVWNLWLRALAATQEQRPEEAAQLYAEQLELCRQIGYVRGTVVSMEGLGEANVAAAKLDDAAVAFVEGVRSADRMGMIPDVLSMMAKLGAVWAKQGLSEPAVELEATVLAEPNSDRLPFTGTEPIRDIATATLDELARAMDPEVYETAFQRGTARPYDVAVKELLSARSGGP